MNKGFWGGLKKPILALAPMADVTDPPFRAIIARCGKPDVMFTEFVSCDGLMSAGRERILKDLLYSEEERPVVAQIFGSRPENFEKTARLISELGFNGIDINMGCPDRSVLKQGAGAELIRNPSLAKEIIHATTEGAGDLPVSVKTRIGYNEIALLPWLSALLSTKPVAITLHARTKKEMSKVPAHWDVIAEAVRIRDDAGSETLIIGNGDVKDIPDALRKIEETRADGVMFGRVIFGNPWFFNSKARVKEKISLREILETLSAHVALYQKQMGGVKSFSIMKKHFKAYIPAFPGSKELRTSLMEARDAKEVEKFIHEFLFRLPAEALMLQ